MPHNDNSPAATNDVEVRCFADQAELARAVAREFVATVCRLQTTQNTVRVVLTGGGAGIATLRAIAELDDAARRQADSFPIDTIDWSRVLVFFGDERFVPRGHEDRNDAQADAALLDHVAIPEDNVFRYAEPTTVGSTSSVDQELRNAQSSELDMAAASYAQAVRTHAPDGFDIHLLGMGPEGHINSLFPHTDELLAPKDIVVAVRQCPKPPAERVSLSMDCVNTAQHVWLVVSGAEKSAAATHVVSRADGAEWPAALVEGRKATILWVDQAAAPNQA